MATTTATTQQLDHVLEDYKIHLTGEDAAETSQNEAPSVQVNPPNWPSDRHRVPPYRPINRNLDYEQRTLGSNAFETALLVIMFSGVSLNATSAKIWGRTGGPFFPGLFRYAIGGEW